MTDFLNAIAIVIPIVFVLAYGYLAGKFKAFEQPGAIPVINKLVLTFTLPPSLFIGTLSIDRTQLGQDITLFLSLLSTLLIAYAIGFYTARHAFKRNNIESSIAGLAVSFAAGPFYGPALLEDIYGQQSLVAISIIAIALNVFIVPLAVIIIRIELARQKNATAPILKMLGTSLYEAIFKTPYVWAPLLGITLVLLGITVPQFAKESLSLIGKATAGVAVFVAGLTIATYTIKITSEVIIFTLLKNIAMPTLFWCIALSFGMNVSSDLFKEGLLLCALASGPIIVLLATQYQHYQQQAASILTVSTLTMLITLSALIALIT